MCLKDCIRNRAKTAADPNTFVHIPYRQSKLSLLLKDAFELGKIQFYPLKRKQE